MCQGIIRKKLQKKDKNLILYIFSLLKYLQIFNFIL